MTSIKIKFLQAILVGSFLAVYPSSASYSDSMDLGGLNAKNNQVIGTSSDWAKPSAGTIIGVLSMELAPAMLLLGGAGIAGVGEAGLRGITTETLTTGLPFRLTRFALLMANKPAFLATALTTPSVLAGATSVAATIAAAETGSARAKAFTSDVSTVMQESLENGGSLNTLFGTASDTKATANKVLQLAKNLESEDTAVAAKEQIMVNDELTFEKESAMSNAWVPEMVEKTVASQLEEAVALSKSKALAQEEVIKGLEVPKAAVPVTAAPSAFGRTPLVTYGGGPTFTDNGRVAAFNGTTYHLERSRRF